MQINCTEIYGKNVLEMYMTQEYRSVGVHIRDTRIQKCWGAHISDVNLGEYILYYTFGLLNMEVAAHHPSSLMSWCSQ